MTHSIILWWKLRSVFPVSAVWKKQKMFLPHPRVKVSIVGSLRDREVACSPSDRQGSNFESCVWRTVSSHTSHQPQEVLLVQFSLYVHKGGIKPDSFPFLPNLKTMFGQGTVCLSKHDTQTSLRLGQHENNVVSMYFVCWECAVLLYFFYFV